MDYFLLFIITFGIILTFSIWYGRRRERLYGARKVCEAFKRIAPYEYERFKIFCKSSHLNDSSRSIEDQDYTLFVGMCKDYFRCRLGVDCGLSQEDIISTIKTVYR